MSFCVNCFSDTKGEEICPYCGYAGEELQDRAILKPGTILNDKYILGRTLGRGGFGISYLAYDMNLKIKVCIKEYFPGAISTRNLETTEVVPYSGEAESNFEYGKEKFIEEGRTLAKFYNIPVIVVIHDFFKENGTAYIVMEYLDGVDLSVFLQNQPRRRLDWEEMLLIMRPVLHALSEIHIEGIIHRDISPDNIFITKYNKVKLLDFGAARFAIGEQAKSMSVILKHGYAPFEQYSRNAKQGPWTDVYAICATIYHCITGIKPPDATDRVEDDMINLPSLLGSDITKPAEEALMKGLCVQSKSRLQSVEDLIETFDNGGNVYSERPIKEYINVQVSKILKNF